MTKKNRRFYQTRLHTFRTGGPYGQYPASGSVQGLLYIISKKQVVRNWDYCGSTLEVLFSSSILLHSFSAARKYLRRHS